MIDGIVTMRLATDVEALERNPLLKWVDKSKDGELLERTANAHGLRLRVKYPTDQRNKVADLRGSLHAFHRAALRGEVPRNADTFTPAEVWQAVETLRDWYGFDPEKTTLNGLEFGANLVLPFPVETLLTRAICYGKRPFVEERGGVPVWKCGLTQYAVKLYDKGQQFRLSENLLRVEVAVSRMQYFTQNRVSLNTLADLRNPSLYQRLRALLVETFAGILFDEPAVSTEAMTGPERELLHRGRNARTWEKLSANDFSNPTEYNRQRQRQGRDLDQFRHLLTRHRTGPDVGATVAGILAAQVADLMPVPEADLSHSYRFSEGGENGGLSHSYILEDMLKCDREATGVREADGPFVGDGGEPVPLCLVTGVPLEVSDRVLNLSGKRRSGKPRNSSTACKLNTEPTDGGRIKRRSITPRTTCGTSTATQPTTCGGGCGGQWSKRPFSTQQA